MKRAAAIVEADRQVVQALQARGDSLTIAREVQHWAYFSSRAGADAYIAWLADGFTAIDVRPDEDREDLPIRVTYAHCIRPTVERVTEHTVPANAMAERLGGAYDGWETSVETESSGEIP